MLRFHAHSFVNMTNFLSRLHKSIASGTEEGFTADTEDTRATLSAIEDDCQKLHLNVSVGLIRRLRHRTGTIGTDRQRFGTLLEGISNTIEAELEQHLFFQIPNSQAEKYFDVANWFGMQIFVSFPAATFDIEEAGKCFALDRYTASVFHLFRVAEIGLRALAKQLDVEYSINGWDTLLKKIDTEQNKKREQKDPDFLADETFYTDAAAHLRNYKQSRNNTNHPDKKYTQEEADRIFDSVRIFMQHLATKVSEMPETFEMCFGEDISVI